MPNVMTKSICSYCGVGCGVSVECGRRGEITVCGDEAHPVNRGLLCSKGQNLHQVVMDRSDRLLHPRMRWSRSHPMQRVSWDAAMDRTAAVFRSLIARFGPDSVAMYVSGQMLTEEYYIANKLVKGFLGTNNIDTNSRLCMSSAVAGYKLALGDDAVPISYDDIERCECFVIAGANPAWCHPIVYQRIERHKAENPNVKVIVIDPRRTATCAIADLHLQIRPGSDVALLNAIARRLIETARINERFIRDHCDGFEALRAQVMATSIAQAARDCEVSQRDINIAAEIIGDARSFLTLWAMGLNQSVVGVEKNLALLNLSLLTGKIGKPGCGPFSLTGQPNAMGGREVGGMANLLAAHRDLASAKDRAEVADFWGSESISDRPGHTATELFSALESGKVKAVWIICTNPAVSLPNVTAMERGLRAARFVVVQDISARSDTLDFADVVLPAAGWLEKTGTMTNSERRISYLPKLLDPPGEARPDAWILCDFAKRMGFSRAFGYADEAAIFDEYRRMTAGTRIDICGVGHKRLKLRGSVQWPCPTEDHPGTPRLFGDHRFATANGRAKLHAVSTKNRSTPPTAELPFILTTGRLRDQWHTMTRTGKVARLRQHADAPFVELHPGDAAPLAILAGDTVKVVSENGEVQVRAVLTDTVKRGVVFIPMHWGRRVNGDLGRVNRLTSGRVDPRSKEPDFKYTPVSISKVRTKRRRVVVVGAGAAALSFIQACRERDSNDDIHVFSREPSEFYNRVLLVEYVSGRRRWDDLPMCDDSTMLSLDVTMHTGITITKVDRRAKIVHDNRGQQHPYDVLVLATGSRANVIPGVPTQAKNVLTLRSREDADRVRRFLSPESRVIVVGGGLLGVEMSAEFASCGTSVTLVQSSPRLMGRQLDATGSAILAELIEDRGVRVVLNDEIIRYTGKRHITEVRTKAGRTLACDVLLIATGVRPNIELGVEAGLAHRRGLIVDDCLRTSDPSIRAIGEIAEHNEQLYGMTAAAREQGSVAAAHVAGDAWSNYRGSTPQNMLKVAGLELCSIGQTRVAENNAGFDEVVVVDRARHYYKKCVIQHNRLVGAILIGDLSELGAFRGMIESGMELDDRREQLLRTEKEFQSLNVKGPVVCVCHSVGSGNLQELIAEGCTDLGKLCERSGAGTGCGSCRPEVRAILDAAVGNRSRRATRGASI